MKSLILAVSTMFAGLGLFAQNTTFTYQGQLNDGGNPANGTNYDISFALYDASTNGSFLGVQAFTALSVSNGLFTVSLNFGNVFNGAPRWLELTVGKNGSNYSVLTPRQQLTPTPYSIFATTASNVSGTVPANQLTGPVPSASLTSVPAASLTGSGTLPAGVLPSSVALLGANQTFTGVNYFTAVLARGGPPGPFGDNYNGYAFSGNGGDDDSGMFSLGNGEVEFFNNANEVMRLQNGYVGIGVTNPALPLQVNGNVGIGPGGTNYAANGLENLQIIRGIVANTGAILQGAGFTVLPVSAGVWNIYFTGIRTLPSVTVSAFSGGSAFIVAIANVSGQPSYCTIETTVGGSPQNVDFSFIAACPQ